jgi:hypothetical protein
MVGLACEGGACGLDTAGLELPASEGGQGEAGGSGHDASGSSTEDATTSGDEEGMNADASPSGDSASFEAGAPDVHHGGPDASGPADAGMGESDTAGDIQSIHSSTAPDAHQDGGSDAGGVVPCSSWIDCPAPLACDSLTRTCTDVCSAAQVCGGGCCDRTGHCQSGATNDACGPLHGSCAVCTSTQTCVAYLRCAP